MVDNKLVFGLIAVLLVAAVVGVVLYQRKNSKENFGMLPSFTHKIERVAAETSGPQKGDYFSVPGTYQSMISPRNSGGISYGPYINYRIPDQKNLGVPEDPLSYNNMVKENFDVNTSNCAQALADVRSSSIASGLARSAIMDGMPDLVQDPYPTVSDMLPVGDMTTVNAMNEESQVVVYDRFMVANRNSRLRGQGDMIRGDLAIVPCNKGWFQVSVQPNIDLQAGALNVMGGYDNESGQKLSALINVTSGGADTTIAGVNLGNQFATTLGAGQTDVTVTAYP
jgi:hypothetical protein